MEQQKENLSGGASRNNNDDRGMSEKKNVDQSNDEIPHIISYPRLPNLDATTGKNEKDHLLVNRKPSDLTDARSIVRFDDSAVAGETSSLLLLSPSYSDAVAREDGLIHAPRNQQQQQPESKLTSPVANIANKFSQYFVRSKTLGDIPSSARRPRTLSWAENSDSSLFSGTLTETKVYAPDNVSLPPQTPLWGSSKFVANARTAELKRASSSSRAAAVMDSSTRSGLSQQEALEKVRKTFYEDAIEFAEGTIPQSIVLATVIGAICGIVAFLYYLVLLNLLQVLWKDLPNALVARTDWPESLHVLWIPLVTFTMSVCSGLSIYYLGEPGDLAYTIKCVHEKAYESTEHILPMLAASLFSILAGASLGPEAPLVGICAATAGFVSRKVFKQSNRNVVRKHTLMGMAGALAAFFGVPLGGSLFALEVNSRYGIEYFEHMIEAIFCGEVCVAVFRSLAQIPMGKIWEIQPTKLQDSEPVMIVVGAAIGLLGAGVALIFATFHWRLMDCFKWLGLLDDENRNAVPRALLGATVISTLGMLIPHTMFWGEFEFGVIATGSPASELPHIWPTSGLLGFEMNSCGRCVLVGVSKILAISFTVAAGYRGGYIFPLFTAGAAFGRALVFLFPKLSPSIACLCFAAAMNVAITRTALATSLILAFLSGEQYALPAILASSIVSLFTTSYTPFIKSQIVRSDIDHSLYYRSSGEPRIQDTVHAVDYGLVPVDNGNADDA